MQDDRPGDWARALLAEQRESASLLRASLRRDHADIVAASEGSNADDEHDPEGSTIAFERSQVSALTAQTEHHLVEIEAALGRVDDGTYGMCEVCGDPIPRGRLEARPTARRCVQCAG